MKVKSVAVESISGEPITSNGHGVPRPSDIGVPSTRQVLANRFTERSLGRFGEGGTGRL